MFRTTCPITVALALLGSGAVYAVGNHTQGTYVCGVGLEVLVGVGGQPQGNCLAVTAGTMTSNGPLTLKDTTGATTASTTITLTAACTRNPTGGYWSCPSATSSPLYICGATAANPTVSLVVVEASLLNGKFSFGSGNLTVICGGSGDPGATPEILPSCWSQPHERYSTADDCIAWHYAPSSSAADQNLFNACVHMARADYSGTGKSATRVGTWVEPYDGPPGKDPPTCVDDCDAGLEALWDENGATCISHPRWQEVVARLVSIAHLTEEQLQSFQRRLRFLLDKGTLNCEDGGLEKALLKNRSRIYSCNRKVLEIRSCGNKTGGYDPDCQNQCPLP